MTRHVIDGRGGSSALVYVSAHRSTAFAKGATYTCGRRMPPIPSLIATVLDGKFRIERALASGAAGDVYEATHLMLGSRVAVKVLRDGSAENGEARRRRFMHEARFAAGIQSEHVVRVFDFAAHEGGLAYIVMELLQGETLAQRVRRVGPLPISTAVEYVIQAATPLALLHEGGVVHRDVKPSNLFLACDSEGKERVKLLDFGVAAFRRSVSETSFAAGRALIGTPRYMAPEQVRASEQIDARADVWALGVTLYELLAGRPPFDAESVLSVLRQIERKTPVPLQQRRAAVPARLAAVVRSCLEKDSARRPPNARALVDALVPLRESLVGLELAETSGDALDLSWNDPDVEELRPVRRQPPRPAVMAAVLLAACALTAGAMGARRSIQSEAAANETAALARGAEVGSVTPQPLPAATMGSIAATTSDVAPPIPAPSVASSPRPSATQATTARGAEATVRWSSPPRRPSSKVSPPPSPAPKVAPKREAVRDEDVPLE
jgi:serine/threonine protein kinase